MHGNINSMHENDDEAITTRTMIMMMIRLMLSMIAMVMVMMMMMMIEIVISILPPLLLYVCILIDCNSHQKIYIRRTEK